MFTGNHFIWLAIIVTCITAAILLIKKFNPRKILISRIVLVLVVILKALHISLSMVESDFGGMVIEPTQLSFHLCSMQIYFVIIINIVKNEKVINTFKSFMVPSMLIGAFMALLIPTCGVEFTSARVYEYFLIHGVYVFFGLYLLIIEKVDMSFKAYRNNIGILFGCASIAFMVNSILMQYGTNFLYLRKPPMDNLPILNLNNGWYVYIVSLALIALTLVTLVHLPYLIKDIKNYLANKKVIKESQIC